jgi:hypothetical protein
MVVPFHSVQLTSYLFIYLLLGHLCVITLTALQIKCLETTPQNTFMIKSTAHSNLEIIAAIHLITFILRIRPL